MIKRNIKVRYQQYSILCNSHAHLKYYILIQTPISIGHLVEEIWAILWSSKQCKTYKLVNSLSLQLKINIPDIRLFPLDHVTYFTSYAMIHGVLSYLHDSKDKAWGCYNSATQQKFYYISHYAALWLPSVMTEQWQCSHPC